MPARNPDGTWRNKRKPLVLTPKMLITRWVEAEVLRLKRFGLTFSSIAEQITAVEETCRKVNPSQDPAKLLTELLGLKSEGSEPAGFWSRVKTNLQAGRNPDGLCRR